MTREQETIMKLTDHLKSTAKTLCEAIALMQELNDRLTKVEMRVQDLSTGPEPFLRGEN